MASNVRFFVKGFVIELGGQPGVASRSAERTWPQARDRVDGTEGRGRRDGFGGGRAARPKNGVEEGHNRDYSGVGGENRVKSGAIRNNEVEPTEESKRSEICKFIFSSNLCECAP